MPTTKIRAENRPTKAARSASGTPTIRKYGARYEKTWLTPRPSTIDVIQKTVTTRGQSARP